jgi:hypothetical protein
MASRSYPPRPKTETGSTRYPPEPKQVRFFNAAG